MPRNGMRFWHKFKRPRGVFPVLQTAMFAAFGSGLDTDLPNALTGAGVCTLTVCVGVYMLIKASKEAKELKKYDGQEEI